MTFATDEIRLPFDRLINQHAQVLQLLGMYFHANARRTLGSDRVVDGVLLSTREFECWNGLLAANLLGRSGAFSASLDEPPPFIWIMPERSSAFARFVKQSSGSLNQDQEDNWQCSISALCICTGCITPSCLLSLPIRSREATMIQLITPGYHGEFVNDLAEMHRLRHRVFKQRLEWDVQIAGDMEVDEFDVLRPEHLLHRSPDGRIQGCVRLLPSTGPTMIRDIFPILLDGQPAPRAIRSGKAAALRSMFRRMRQEHMVDRQPPHTSFLQL